VKAARFATYGSPHEVVKVVDVDRPVPAGDQVLIRVRSASVNPLDRGPKGKPYIVRLMTGLRTPKDPRLGHDVAGRIEAVGANVSGFKVGDDVFGTCHGAFAEFACAGESKIVLKPARMTFEQAASIPVAALTALQGLRDTGRIATGERVLINGASGGVGTFAVQIAKVFGADVTGVCSTKNVDLVRSLGATRVIDYTRADFTAGTERYDLIFDCAGNRSLSAVRRLLKPGGRYVAVGAPPEGRWLGPIAHILKAFVLSRFARKSVLLFLAKISQQDLRAICELVEAEKVTPVIDRRYRLNDAGEAIGYLDFGHARGKVIIAVSE
jgi:NADPH:quinone reductase-like Zn-dependent oxidoreductase